MPRYWHPKHGFHVVGYGDDPAKFRAAGWVPEPPPAPPVEPAPAAEPPPPEPLPLPPPPPPTPAVQALPPQIRRGPGRPRRGY